MKKNKIIFLSLILIFLSTELFAQSFCVEVISGALKKDSLEETILHLSTNVEKAKTNFDKRIIFSFLGSIQEQATKFKEASASFAKAVSFSVTQTEINSFVLPKDANSSQKIVYNMLKKTSSILVLDAVRCSLNAGDSKNAEIYLNSSIRNSKDEKIIAKIKLYEIWCRLCNAENDSELEEVVLLLKAYSKMKSMEPELPSVLFTLWYVNCDEEAGKELIKRFPNSIESSIVLGNSQIMPTPFWFFVKRNGNALVKASDAKAKKIAEKQSSNIQVASNNKVEEKTTTEKVKRQQVGLFGKKSNAEGLIQRLKEKGFSAYIEEEIRPSGNKYFLVIVDENEKGDMGMLLKTAGFDCYPVY